MPRSERFHRRIHSLPAWLVVLLILSLTTLSLGEVKMEVEAGYDGHYRAGRWSPVMIKLQSDKPIDAQLEVRVPTSSNSIINIHQVIGISQEKQSHIVYAPLSLMYDPLRITLRASGSGKVLAEFPDRDITAIDRGNDQMGFLMLTSGRSPVGNNLHLTDVQGSTHSVHYQQDFLPITPMGYDALDLLFLNKPDWSRMSVDQVTAIQQWVQSGGVLLLQPGDEAVPAPVATMLPGQLQSIGTINLDKDLMQQYGFAERYKTIAYRPLEPSADAQSFNLLGSTIKVYWKNVGLGRVGVVMIDVGSLQFADGEVYQKFWHDLIFNICGIKPKTNNYNYYQNPSELATNAGLDRIGQIPQTGAFGFTYIALTVGLLMLIVGPIDFFVLKKIGRQPWTWATTIGWIGLFTCAALTAGHFLRSGDLHYRTLSLYDQVDEKVVGMDNIALIYAPKSAYYEITAEPTSWWQPIPSGNLFRSTDSFALPLDTYQDYRGNQAGKMWIDLWNYRFLRGSQFLDQPPMLKSDLRIEYGRLVGTITNLTSSAMSDIEVYYITNGQAVNIDGALQPNESRKIDIDLATASRKKTGAADAEEQHRDMFGNPTNLDLSIRTDRYSYIYQLNQQRETAVARLADQEHAVIFATVEKTTSNVSLDDQPTAKTEHTMMVRAVTKIRQSGDVK